jgi:hypothetical protein
MTSAWVRDREPTTGNHRGGVGRPAPYPEPAAKSVDLITLADNRWVALARAALSGLRPGMTRVELPTLARDCVLERLGTARIMVHPARIEGRSRLSEEARAMPS